MYIESNTDLSFEIDADEILQDAEDTIMEIVNSRLDLEEVAAFMQLKAERDSLKRQLEYMESKHGIEITEKGA